MALERSLLLPPVKALPTEFSNELKTLFPAIDLLTSEADLIAYSYDNSQQQVKPQAVVFPRSQAQLQSLLKACARHRIAMVARGKGTGTAGAAVPVAGGVVASFERMNRILEIDPDNRLARVEPGVTNQQLQQALAEHGFFWPPDPTSASVCTVGGNLACNAAGPRAVKYGTPRENTLGLRAVTGTGDALKTGVSTTKGVVGYDLTRLIIGSEGTLAIITEAVLKLTPLAESKRTLQAIYGDMGSATQAVSAIMAQPVIPCALEFMDSSAIRMVKDYADPGLPEQAAALLMIEVDGSSDAVDQAAAKVAAAANTAGCLAVETAATSEQVAQLWRTRKALSPALRNIAPKKINEDVVVPVSRIPELIEGLEQLSASSGIPIVNFGHAGNGNIHVNLLINPDDPKQMAAADDCLDEVFGLVLRLQGTLSGEHGIGLVKRNHIRQELDPTGLQLMRDIKRQFDPNNILNPGKSLPDEASPEQGR